MELYWLNCVQTCRDSTYLRATLAAITDSLKRLGYGMKPALMAEIGSRKLHRFGVILSSIPVKSCLVMSAMAILLCRVRSAMHLDLARHAGWFRYRFSIFQQAVNVELNGLLN